MSGECQKVEIGNGIFYIGDCFDVMRDLPDGSVDMVLCDLPYGTTACKWDSVLPFDDLWSQYSRLVDTNAAVVLTASQPFTSALIMSNAKMFRYQWIWDKKIPSGMSYARFQPMRQHEDVLVFCQGKVPYFPQMTKRDKPIKEGGKKKSESAPIANFNSLGGKVYEMKNPVTLIQFEKVRRGSIHPTQKPVALFEYLIRTYTNEDMVVLDNTAGSGTTAIAAENAGRRWICIERDPEYAAKAIERIRAHVEHKNVIPFRQPAREVEPLFIPVESPLWWAIAV